MQPRSIIRILVSFFVMVVVVFFLYRSMAMMSQPHIQVQSTVKPSP